jgi:phage-related protein
MVQPLIEGSYEKELIGNGTIANEGNFETPMIIEVKGFSMYPSITIGDTLLEYAGNIEAGQTLIIDTEKQTAMIGSTNVLAYYNGEFPLLQPGSVNVTADNNVAIRWKDKYL